MAISKKFCEMMGGEITVESVPGQGTTFTVRLPTCAEQRPTPAAPADAAIGAADGAKVLVIDDDVAVRQLVGRMLGKEGFRVLEAASGEQGLALARSEAPDVITLDVLMPGMDGWAVLTALKGDPALAAIPVVMLTITDERNLGFSLGAAEYLTKPIDRAQLSAVLARYRGPSGAGVLIVEDDAATRATLRRSLEKEGWTVTEADNGRTGLERLATALPALVLLDLIMPEMDGFEFLDELRSRDSGDPPPVIVITSKDLTEADRRRLNGGVRGVVRKRSQDIEGLLADVRRRVWEHARNSSSAVTA